MSKSINESKAEVISRINERLKADGIYDDSGGIFGKNAQADAIAIVNIAQQAMQGKQPEQAEE